MKRLDTPVPGFCDLCASVAPARQSPEDSQRDRDEDREDEEHPERRPLGEGSCDDDRKCAASEERRAEKRHLRGPRLQGRVHEGVGSADQHRRNGDSNKALV